MVSSIEGGQFPRPLINMEAVQAELKKGLNPETGNIIGEKLPKAIGIYQGNLRQDGVDVAQKELAQTRRAELEEHIKHLDVLTGFLKEFSQNPMSFEATVNSISEDEQSYTARFKRRNDPHYGQREANAQTQINFFARDLTGESIGDTRRAVGLQGRDAHATMETIRRQAEKRIVQINTIGVFFNPDTRRTQLLLQGGIMIKQIGEKVLVSGFTYVGTTPHEYDLGKASDFSLAEFKALRSLVMRLSGKPAQTPKLRRAFKF